MRRLLLVLTVFSLTGLAGLPAHAREHPLRNDIIPRQSAPAEIGPDEAASRARQAVSGGRVMSVTRSRGDYRVKILKRDGRVYTVYVDARTGQVH